MKKQREQKLTAKWKDRDKELDEGWIMKKLNEMGVN